jgi:hypothetical protein
MCARRREHLHDPNAMAGHRRKQRRGNRGGVPSRDHEEEGAGVEIPRKRPRVRSPAASPDIAANEGTSRPPADRGRIRSSGRTCLRSGMLIQPFRSHHQRGPAGKNAHDDFVAGDRLPPSHHQRQPGAVLPPGAAIASVAPTCANVGQVWRVNRRQHGWVLFGEFLLAHCASPRKARKLLILW